MNKELQFLVYSSPVEDVKVKAIVKDETIWLTQRGMSELFDVNISTINEHLKNVYASGELEKDPTIRNFRIVQKEGEREVSRLVDFYNLDAIISVGYRVNSSKATQFRIWATKVLKEYKILPDKGKVSAKDAKEKAENEYEIFNKTQKIESDFDKALKKITNKMENNNGKDEDAE